MTNGADSVTVYGDRLAMLFLAALCTVLGIWASVSYFVRPTADGGIPWGRAELLNFVVSIAITLALAAGMVFALIRMLTPVPLLKIDATGIHYRPVPLRGWFVPWKDVASIVLIKHRSYDRIRAITDLTLLIRPKAGPAARLYGTRMLQVSLGQLGRRSIISRSEELAEQIRRFHHIEYADYTDKAPKNPTPQ